MQILRDQHFKDNGHPLNLLNRRVHEAEGRGRAGFAPVSYTHLTLPTKRIV